ncbi:MAG TPA: AAA family ATPase, partial [bacterium]|nr:AAA family ATPase [bacterium]
LSVNLAIELQKRGRNCILVDVDLGLANAHIVAGVAPPVTLIDVTEGVYSLAEVIVEGPAGIGMIAGGSGVLELANLPGYKRTQLLMELEKIEHRVDYIILDMGTGISATVLDFMAAADASLVVTTPDITAVTDAYGMLKVLNRYGVASRAGIICNQVSSATQGKEIFNKLQTCCSRFLDFSPHYWGHIFKDSSVGKATAERVPYVLSHPYSRASRCTSLIAESIYREPISKKESSFRMMRSGTTGT